MGNSAGGGVGDGGVGGKVGGAGGGGPASTQKATLLPLPSAAGKASWILTALPRLAEFLGE